MTEATLVERLLERVRDFLDSVSLESGYCCCGDKIEQHNIGSGHSPVDELAYATNLQIERIDATLERARTLSAKTEERE